MWYVVKGQQVELKVFVKLNAQRTAWVDVNPLQGVVIALHAKPHAGEANRELIRFLAESLSLPKSQVILCRGEKSRCKKVSVPIQAAVQLLITDPQQFLQHRGSRASSSG